MSVTWESMSKSLILLLTLAIVQAWNEPSHASAALGCAEAIHLSYARQCDSADSIRLSRECEGRIFYTPDTVPEYAWGLHLTAPACSGYELHGPLGGGGG